MNLVSPDPFCQNLLTHTQETRKGEQSKEGKTRIKDHIPKEKLELEQKAPKEENIKRGQLIHSIECWRVKLAINY
ncbi:hypothetical protein Prudu_230S000200 [Prunus dulcis]|uniref:Uncharacterized protein n=1 Tax=Prunus dulcis TaxID=3755 RepID=A0A5H2XLW3_PRUDU|nr:hypothetical protein Prudu_230S000200 [Prunus dulcis]